MTEEQYRFKTTTVGLRLSGFNTENDDYQVSKPLRLD